MTFASEGFVDFEDVTVGSVVLVVKPRVYNQYSWSEPRVDFVEGDMWIIDKLADRPRRATMRNLQRGTLHDMRVDDLLGADYDGFVVIGPA